MSLKRSRVDSTSNHLDAARPRSGSRATEPMPAGADQFLGRCYYCKKLIPEGSEIFMYSNCGFCSVECRQVQIALDKAAMKQQVEGNQGKSSV